VLSIELYPIWGITRFGEPYSRFEHCVIAWGGVVAQVIVGVPLVVWVEIFGYTGFQAVNAILAILGFLSLSMAVLNPTSALFRVGSFVFYDLEFFSSLPALTCHDLRGRITSAVMPSVA